jgi:hypothetical protein
MNLPELSTWFKCLRALVFARSEVISAVGRAIAEADSRWLPTAAARVQSRVWSSGICGGQSGAGAGTIGQ